MNEVAGTSGAMSANLLNELEIVVISDLNSCSEEDGGVAFCIAQLRQARSIVAVCDL